MSNKISKTSVEKIKATSNDAGRTLFKVITNYFNNIPLSKIEKLFRKKEIKVNGVRVFQKNYIVSFNDEIVIYGIFDPHKEETFTNFFSFNVIYEDTNILIINKPTGVPIHSEEEALDNQVLSYLKYKKIDSFKPTHVGRLDKETSGIMLYVKNYPTLKKMNLLLQNITKTYAFKSDFSEEKKEVVLYISKDELNKKMRASYVPLPNSKISKTSFFMVKKGKFARIETGRKHQIRVTLAKLGFPIYGDYKYGGKKAARLMLHCCQIKFSNFDGDLKYLNELEFESKPKW